MKSEPWRIEMSEKVYQKALKIKTPSSFISNKKKLYRARKSKTFFKNTVSFHLASNHSPRRFPRFSSWALCQDITGESGPEY